MQAPTISEAYTKARQAYPLHSTSQLVDEVAHMLGLPDDHVAETLFSETQPPSTESTMSTPLIQKIQQAQTHAAEQVVISHLQGTGLVAGQPSEQPKPQATAAKHLLKQMLKNPRLTYFIGPGTESFHLITKEVAEQSGQPVEEFQAAMVQQLQIEPWPRGHAELLKAAKRLDDLRHFTATSCANNEQMEAMQAMREAIEHADM